MAISKPNVMKRFIIVLPLAGVLFFSACSKGELTIEEKKDQIAKYKEEMAELEGKISALENEIAEAGGSLEAAADTVPVTTITVARIDYEEFVEVAGTVSSDQNILVSSEIGGTVTRVYAEEGQRVSAGQTLLTTDDQILQKSMEELESQYELARTVYEKRKALWDQNIGSEIEYLTAKNNMESLELRLNTTKSQWAKTQLRAPISGVVDEVITKAGEMASPGMPLLRVVNLNNVKIESAVSEAYVGKLNRGDKVEVNFPSIDYSTEATISSVGQVINPSNRTFTVEVSISNKDGMLKPNLLGTIRIREYNEADQVVIPTRLIQKSNNGDFVYIVEDGMVKKAMITRGRSHNGQTQVAAGLNGGETLIEEGYRQAKEGDIAKVVELQTASKQ